MATTYHDWASQSTPTARLTRLRLHMSEIEAMISGPDVGADGKTVDRNVLELKMKRLMEAATQLESQGAGALNNGTVRARRR